MKKMSIIFVMIMLGGCAADMKVQNVGTTGQENFYLAPKEKDKIEMTVLAGDPTRMFDLYWHSSIYELKGFRWMLLGVKLKEPNLTHNFNTIPSGGCPQEVLIRAMPVNAFRLSDDDVKTMAKKAEADDGRSAFWLFLHYRFSANDIKESEKWRTVAEKTGIVLAKDSYWKDPRDGQYKWQGYSWVTEKTADGQQIIRMRAGAGDMRQDQ
jgi:hypothetical protein